MSKAYSSNLTQWQWELIEPLIPLAKPGGRDREVEIWSVLNAIFDVHIKRGATDQPNPPKQHPIFRYINAKVRLLGCI